MSKKPFRAADGPMLMLIAFGSMMLAQLVASVAILFTGTSGTSQNEINEYVNLAGMLLFQGVFITVYFVYKKKKGLFSSFSPFNKITIWSIIAAPVISVVCFFSFMGLAYYFDRGLKAIGFAVDDVVATTPLSIVMLILATTIAAPIGEELIFRDGLLSGITKVRKDELGTCLISGLCFALMHINPSQTVYQFCLGSAIAYVVLRTRSSLTGMIIHSVSNIMAIILMFTPIGKPIDAFYSKIGSNVLITLLCCLALPVIAVALIWFVTKLLKSAERKKYVQKFTERRIVWIDETTKEPIYEGEKRPIVTEGNRVVQRGYSSITGAPVIVDRLELQEALMEEYNLKHNEKSGGLGKNTYKTAFVIYFVLTVTLWFLTLGSVLLSAYLT